jgi:glycosyltransferase involved in cell wall biosynthesis
MKVVSVVVPTYNEQENIPLVYEKLNSIFSDTLKNYALEIIFIDNHSIDNSRKLIADICGNDKRVKAIFNVRNFGFTRSVFYGLTQATGDAVILLFADMQDSPDLILDFIREWENGYKIVLGIKNNSNENKMLYFLRSCYYKLLSKIGEVEHIEHFTGFGLYDRAFIEILKTLDDPFPYLRGIVAEFGSEIKSMYYTQNVRKFGKSNFNLYKLYDLAMLGITSYSKSLLRLTTLLSFFVGSVSVLIALVTLIFKLLNWQHYEVGITAIVCGIFFIGALQLFFIGLLGEYVLSINTRVLRRPLVVEEKRINF